MAIKRADVYEHNNPVLAIVDSNFLRGGGRVVADLTALYALSDRPDQLKERVTKVWVTAESAYYILVDDANIGNSNGWAEETGGGGTWGSITGTLSDQTDLQTALDGKVDENAAITGATKTKITYDSKGLVTAGDDLAAGDLPTGIDATKIADGTVTNAEFQYLGSVTSDIQTQINSKQETLVSGTNIKTINSTSLLGSGDISVAPATGINATAIGSGTVDNTEFGYLNGVTSAIQTQLDGKQATITGAATTIDTEDLTSSRALVSDASGKVAVSSVTSTELGYLSGVTSAVQTQVDAKIAKYTTEYPSGSNKSISAVAALSQAEYDAIGTKSATTLYFII